MMHRVIMNSFPENSLIARVLERRALAGAFPSLLPKGLVLAAGLMAAACGADTIAGSDDKAARGEAQAEPAVHIVTIEDFEFKPETLTVRKNDTVVWRNLDVVPHTATASDGAWDSGNLDNAAEWSFVFSETGTNDYICLYHPTMIGSVTVID